MSCFASYPKIYALGHPAIAELFDGDVIVEEKIDGSQFSFGVLPGGGLAMRSKGADVVPGNVPKLFEGAVATAQRLFEEGKLITGWVYRGEAIQTPRHNVLCYDRVPVGNFVLYDIMTEPEKYIAPEVKVRIAERMGLECVPHIGTNISNLDMVKLMVGRVSCLGGAQMEGAVFKNYGQFGKDGKPLMGKYVAEAFKEIHQGEWRKANPQKGDIVDQIVASVATPARWQKAVIHLNERGALTSSPVDIGPLMKEVHLDIDAECREYIADRLLAWAMPHIKRRAASGLPQWYKGMLAEQQFTARSNE